MPYAEELEPAVVHTEAPWGATRLAWTSIDQLDLDYAHVLDLTLGTEEEPFLIAYGLSRFTVRFTDGRGDDLGEIVVTHCHTEWHSSMKRGKTEWTLPAATYESCRREIVSWFPEWLEQNRTTYERAAATVAHNELVRLHHRARDGERGPCDALRVRRALARVLPATPWLVTHENAKVRAWAMLMYLPFYRKTSPPSERSKGADCGPRRGR